MTSLQHLEMKIYNLLTTHKIMFIQLIMMFTGHKRAAVEEACQSMAARNFIEELESGIWQLKVRP